MLNKSVLGVVPRLSTAGYLQISIDIGRRPGLRQSCCCALHGAGGRYGLKGNCYRRDRQTDGRTDGHRNVTQTLHRTACGGASINHYPVPPRVPNTTPGHVINNTGRPAGHAVLHDVQLLCADAQQLPR